MDQLEVKSIHHYMRSLHRDIGFFVIGLVVIYSLTGVILIYRDSGFLKQTVMIEKLLATNIDKAELGNILHLKNFSVLRTEAEIMYFKNGNYNSETGLAKYSSNELPSWITKLTSLHKSPSKKFVHWFTTIFGFLLLFLAISSFWMFKPNSKMFRRGIIFTSSGILATLLLLIIL